MIKKSIAHACALAATVALPSLAWAGTETKAKTKPAPVPAPEKLQESAITGDIGITAVTSYYSRGIIQSNHSASLQPYADINFKAFEGDGFLNKAVISLGIWESFTNQKLAPGIKSSTRSWYESDLTPGIALTFGKVTLTESYLMYFSPNDSFGDFQGINSKLAYDDSDLLGALALHPSVTFLKELYGNAGSGDRKGEYWELAVAPGFSAGAATVTFPVALGAGSNHFYARDGYGYVSAGINLAYTLPVSKSYGTWTANVGGTYYNTNKAATAPGDARKADNDVVGSAGIAVAF
jgi:hypothetical protein